MTITTFVALYYRTSKVVLSPLMKKSLISLILLCVCLGVRAQQATLRIDAQERHQHVTGFGGFVCSPQFGYNHMTQSDMKKVWGTGSTVGCNIMRLYIPIGRNAWGQSLQTAKQAKEMGLIVFASPWGQPAEWKTNGTINAKNEDGTTGKLKREYWDDYAKYLNDYVEYLRENGVELDAISIQNEPDWAATYAGCLWSASEIAEFVATYGRQISCKIMAPETLAVNDSYVNELNKSNVLPNFDIYGGHQYGGIQDGYKKLADKGKEIWMTEYLINWNENTGTARNFDYAKDVFNFFRSINTCMLGDFNAWIHYAAKRYYGMLGDGQYGTSSGAVTKRGYVMAHFARFVTGMTRVEGVITDDAPTPLEGSVYLSQSGDTVVAVMINPSTDERSLTLDLPFYTLKGKMQSTTRTQNMLYTDLTQKVETCRPEVVIAPASVNTILFVRSRDRQVSDMKGSVVHFDRIDGLVPTKTTFGTAYKMSGKSVTLDHSNPIISKLTNAANGYLPLKDRYSQLVLEVKKLTSTLNYSSAITTLYYINDKGTLSSHNYGDLQFNSRENFNLVFDLSPNTLTDGCKGIISITNNNWSSILTFTFGDVYLSNGNLYSASMSGAYVADDSQLLGFLDDITCTSLDMTAVTNLPDSLGVNMGNRIIYLPQSAQVDEPNMVVGETCAKLVLSTDGGPFRPSRAFQTEHAMLTCMIDGGRMIMLPFAADVPQGVKAFAVGEDMVATELTKIPAHQPVLVLADGEVSFEGSGEVSYAVNALTSVVRGVYVPVAVYKGSYRLGTLNGEWGFSRMQNDGHLAPFEVYATLKSTDRFVPISFGDTGVETIDVTHDELPVFNVMGQRVDDTYRGMIIVRGKKYIKR